MGIFDKGSYEKDSTHTKAVNYDDLMYRNVYIEQPALILYAFSYDGGNPPIKISYETLRHASIGDMWEALDAHGCERGLHEKRATLIFKKNNGCAVLVETFGTTNDPNPEKFELEPNLIWFSFLDS